MDSVMDSFAMAATQDNDSWGLDYREKKKKITLGPLLFHSNKQEP